MKKLKEKTIKNLCRDASKAAKISFNIKITPKKFESFLEDLIKEESYSDIGYFESLFDCAKRDFIASRLLFEEKEYSLSVYHIQQCIEKLTKAYGLFTGYLTREELYFIMQNKENKIDAVQHDSPKAFLLMLKKKKLQEKILIMFECSGNKIDLDKEIKKYGKLIKRPYKLAKATNLEINSLLKFFKEIGDRIKKHSKRDILFKSRKFSAGLKKRSEKYLSKKEFMEFEKTLNKIPDVFIKKLDLPFNFLFLWLLSILTYPHFLWTRYPKEKNKQLSPEDYNLDLGIVKSLDSLLKIIENRLIKRTAEIIKIIKIQK